MAVELALDLIRTDGGTQPRAELDQKVIDDYARRMEEGEIFPPVIVFYDGTNYWLGDGFQRGGAERQIGRISTYADVRQGTRRDAVLYSIEANTRHGVPLLLSDRKRGAKTLLEDPEWKEWSDREIGRKTGLHHETVGAIRRELYGDFRQLPTNQPVDPSEGVEGVGNFPTNKDKRKTVEEFFRDFPGSSELSDREIARRCGVDHKTVGTIKKELAEEKQRAEEEASNASVVASELEPTPEPEIEPETILTWEPEITEEDPIPEPETSTATTEPLIEPELPQSEIEPVSDMPIAEEPEPILEPEKSIVEPVMGIAEEEHSEPESIEEPWITLVAETESEPEQPEAPVDSGSELTQEPEIEEEPAPITISGVLAPSEETMREREIKRQQTQERNEQLREKGAELPTGKYACLVVDPPWPMKKIEREVRPNQVEFDYPTMSEEELKTIRQVNTQVSSTDGLKRAEQGYTARGQPRDENLRKQLEDIERFRRMQGLGEDE